MRNFLKKTIVLPLIVFIALAWVMYKVISKPPIGHEKQHFPTKTVEIISARKLPFRYHATGYGSVEPVVALNVKTETSGKISYIHPALKKGASLAKDTVVLRIEPTAFEFSLDQSKAVLDSSQYSLKQLEAEEKSLRRSVKIAQKNLQIGEKELERFLKLWEKRLVPRSTVDSEEQKVLQLRQQLEDLQGKLASYSSRKSATLAQIKKSRTQLAQSKDTLWRTEIRLPFDARIGQVAVEKGEYVAVGALLFEALGIQAVEIKAQLPINQFLALISGLGWNNLNLKKPEDLQAVFSRLQLEANVRLVGDKSKLARWQGELIRIGESVDPVRHTIDLVVAVNNPYADIIPGKRPTLLKGMYVAVDFFTPAQARLVVPRKAIHQGRIYIAKENDRLEIRSVDILHKQGSLVVIETGVKAEENIIISDVIPVIEGLPLKPVRARSYEKRLALAALGEAGLDTANNRGTE